MTVRDVYIFERVDRVDSEVDCDSPEAEALDDVRYARRLRAAPLITERAVRRSARARREAVIAEREIEDEDVGAAADDVVLTRAPFGGLGGMGAALAVIGLLILMAAWSGPTWGWSGARSFQQAPDAYGFAQASRAAYADDYRDSYAPAAAYPAPDFGADAAPFVDPPHAMMVGGTLLLVGVLLLAARRRRFLSF